LCCGSVSLAATTDEGQEIIEEQSMYKYEGVDDNVLVSTYIKDTELLNTVISIYNSSTSSSVNSSNFTKGQLSEYTGALVINNGNVKSVEGLGIAKKASKLDISKTSVTAIPDSEFAGCGFTEVVFPTGLKTLGKKSFQACESLKKISAASIADTLPASLTSIGDQVFAADKALEKIIIPGLTPGNTLEGGTAIFSDCYKLADITVKDGNTVIPDSAFLNAGNGSVAVKVSIGNSVKTIRDKAFSGIKFEDETLDLGNTHVEQIFPEAFRKTTGLTKIILPKAANVSTLSLGDKAFAQSEITTMYASGDTNTNKGIYMPNYINSMGNGCFFGNTKVEKVTLSKNLPKIADYTFDGCNSLSFVTFRIGEQSEATIIGDAAFRKTAIENTDFMLSMNKLTDIGSQHLEGLGKYGYEKGFGKPEEVASPPLGGENSKYSVDDKMFKRYDGKYCGSEVFTGCNNLTDVDMPGSVVNIASRAFYSTAVKKVTWKDGSEAKDRRIYSGAFQQCLNLENLKLPYKSGDTLKIDQYAFAYDIKLSSITYQTAQTANIFPGSLVSLGNGAFFGCQALESIVVNDCDAATGVATPTLSDMIFERCYSLTSAQLPASITKIPRHCFYYAPLTSFKVGPSNDGSKITNIGTLAFCGNRFTTLDLSSYTSLSEISGGAFAYTDIIKEDGKEAHDFKTKLNPNDFTEQYEEASLKIVVLPVGNASMHINTGVFYNQRKFNTMTCGSNNTNGVIFIPDYLVSSGGERSIFGNTGVSKVVWQADTTEKNQWAAIPYLMFEYCANIDKAEDVLPTKPYVQTIYQGAFYGTKIKSANLTALTNLTVIGEGSLTGESPCDDPGVFQNCGELTSVELPACSFKIGKNSFKKAEKLSNVTLGGVTAIGESAFEGDNSLATIAFPASLKSAGKTSFKSCSNLTTVDFKNASAFEKIGDEAFDNCKKLVFDNTNNFPESLKSIGSYAFKKDKIGVAIFGANITEIGDNAFEGTEITSADFDRATSLKTIGGNAFNKSSLEIFDVSKTKLTELKSGTLTGCSNLKKAIFGDSVYYIAENSINGCPKFEAITIASTTYINRKTFHEGVEVNNNKIYTATGVNPTNPSIKVSITTSPEAKLLAKGQTYELPYYINEKGKADTRTLLVGNNSSDSSVQKVFGVSAKLSGANSGYYWATTQNATNKITDSQYFTNLPNSDTKNYHDRDVDVIKIKALNCIDEVDFTVTGGIQFSYGEGKTYTTPNFDVTFKFKVEEIVFNPVMYGRYNDSKYSNGIAGTADFQVTKEKKAKRYYYDLVSTREELPVSKFIASYDVVAISDNPDVLIVTSSGDSDTYPEDGYKTKEATNSEDPNKIKPNRDKMSFVIKAKKIGSANVTVYPKEYVNNPKYATTIKFTVNSDISSISLKVPDEYKEGVKAGTKFNVFNYFKNCVGQQCTAGDFANMAAYTNRTIKFTSSEPDYASVDEAGNVTILKAAKDDKEVEIKAKAINTPDTEEVEKTVRIKILKRAAYEAPTNVVNAESTDKDSKLVVTVTKAADANNKIGEVSIKQTAADANSTTIDIPNSVTISDVKYKVTAIQPGAFANNKKVTTVNIGKNIATIGSKAFSGCTKLTEVSIKEEAAITSIDANAFSGCTKLKTVNIPDNAKITKIGAGAFNNCKSLTSIVIPQGVTTIEPKAFCNCKKLKSIVVKSTVLKKVGKNALKGIHKKCVIKVPKKKFKKYKKLFKKKGQKGSVKIKKA
jgi:hypothetical protein